MYSSSAQVENIEGHKKAVAVYKLTEQQLIENQRFIVPSEHTIVVILEP